MTALAAVVATACATDDASNVGDSTIGDDDTTNEQEADADDPTAESDDSVDASGEDEEPGEVDAAANAPQAYTSLLVQGEPDLTAGGGVAITLGPAGRSDVPFLIRNGTDDTISRVEVSGMAVDGDGNALGSGSSHGVEPNVIPPDGIGFGFVYVGPDDLPPDATINNPAVDYTTGIGDFENIVTLDVTDLTTLDSDFDDFTGTLTNPHDIEVTGPTSVGLACLDGTGGLTGVFSTFADRDNIEPGGTSTFTISIYGDDVACEGYLVGGSGYSDVP